MSAFLKLGGTLSQNVLLGVETNVWTKEEDGARLTLGFVTGTITVYPVVTSGFFLKGGFGASVVDTSADFDSFDVSASKTGWGVLAGIFNTVEYLGPVLVSGGLAIVAFLQFGALSSALAISGVALAITSLEGWLVTPALLGRATRMNAVVVFLGLLFWGWVWGPLGLILAVPMLVIVKAVCDRVDELSAVSRLMSD